MVKRVCDRCGVEMAPEDSVSHAAGHVIIKAESGDINKDWHSLDLCEECRKSFSEWLGARTDMEEQEKEPEIEISPLTEEDVKEDPELENRLKKHGY